MNCSQYQSLKTLQKQFDISSSTLRKWVEDGKIAAIRTSGGGRRLYKVDSVRAYFGIKEAAQANKCGIVYARVSSSHQKEDLQRQVQDLQNEYPDHELVQDVGSGLNFRRKGLQTLLERVIKGLVSEIVVTYKDRLCRYGLELLEFLFEKFGTKLVVHGQAESVSEARELADDLLAITTVFVARHNGRRSQANRRKRKRTEDQEGPDLPNPGPANEVAEVVRGDQMDLQPLRRGPSKQVGSSNQEGPKGPYRQ